jgi:hypothetical protein
MGFAENGHTGRVEIQNMLLKVKLMILIDLDAWHCFWLCLMNADYLVKPPPDPLISLLTIDCRHPRLTRFNMHFTSGALKYDCAADHSLCCLLFTTTSQRKKPA